MENVNKLNYETIKIGFQFSNDAFKSFTRIHLEKKFLFNIFPTKNFHLNFKSFLPIKTYKENVL